jgi:hypothetical protein
MPRLTTDDDIKLYYEEVGSGIAIVFVHEFAGDVRSYELELPGDGDEITQFIRDVPINPDRKAPLRECRNKRVAAGESLSRCVIDERHQGTPEFVFGPVGEQIAHPHFADTLSCRRWQVSH